MAKRKKLLCTEEGATTKKQHTSPCSDCPWRRDSLQGWLGGYDADEFLDAARGDGPVHCHVLKRTNQAHWECAGAAIYRRNSCKLVDAEECLVLPADREKVFSNAIEFKKHHERR